MALAPETLKINRSSFDPDGDDLVADRRMVEDATMELRGCGADGLNFADQIELGRRNDIALPRGGTVFHRHAGDDTDLQGGSDPDSEKLSDGGAASRRRGRTTRAASP